MPWPSCNCSDSRRGDRRLPACTQGAAFDVTFHVGDPSLAAPVSWHAGSFTLRSRAGSGAPVAEPPLSKWEALYATPSHLAHTHAVPAAPPPLAAPFAATAGVVAVFLAWLAAVARLGLNAQWWPQSGTAAAVAASFQIALVATVGLSVYFWARLSLLDLLPALAVLGAVTLVLGHRALSQLADRRLSEEGGVKAAKIE